MKIFSEKTNKYYATVDECLAEEKKHDEAIAKKEAEKKALADTRKARAKEVEDAYKVRLEADKAYREKLNKFINDYGSFHMTINTEVEDSDNPLSFLDNFFDYWF